MRTDFRFSHKLRVRFAETDAQAIVFNGNYLTYYDVAWTEYFRAMGLTYRDLTASGVDTVLARTTLEFKATAEFDEVLEVFVRVSAIGNTSLTFNFEIYAEDGRLVNQAQSVYVCVDPATLHKISIPADLRQRIQAFESAGEPRV
jgi:acyl-CoA thioester hydrolase